MTPALTYRVILLTNFAIILWLLSQRFRALSLITNKRNLVVVSCALFAVWTVVDVLAVSAKAWIFPEGEYVKLGPLPLEEYAVFVVHLFLCLTTVLVAEDVRRERLPHHQ